jgi:phosphotransferase system  glucose/maltose/N-acetylglucosamine-specific IIC component
MFCVAIAMGTQSTAKTVFLLASMVGWLVVGAALMYLSPAIMDQILRSDRTHLWMQNLMGGGYSPSVALMGGGVSLVLTVILNWVWYQRFEGKA